MKPHSKDQKVITVAGCLLGRFFLETLKLPPYQIFNQANIIKNIYLITSSLFMMDSSKLIIRQ